MKLLGDEPGVLQGDLRLRRPPAGAPVQLLLYGAPGQEERRREPLGPALDAVALLRGRRTSRTARTSGSAGGRTGKHREAAGLGRPVRVRRDERDLVVPEAEALHGLLPHREQEDHHALALQGRAPLLLGRQMASATRSARSEPRLSASAPGPRPPRGPCSTRLSESRAARCPAPSRPTRGRAGAERRRACAGARRAWAPACAARGTRPRSGVSAAAGAGRRAPRAA